ncbi:MAG TPA: hypothetical protein VGA36_00720 [Nitriliruptorales bacterium]|jgi:hypothetical protein
MKWMQMFFNAVLVVALLAMISRQGWLADFRQTVFGEDDHIGIVEDNRPLSG